MKPHNHQSVAVLLVFLLLALLGGCERPNEPVKVSLTNLAPIAIKPAMQEGKPLRIAISAVISPKETFVLYKDLLNYISERLGMPIELIQRETYAEVNDMVRNNQLDLAFVCSGSYVDGHDQFGMELLVAPVAYGEPVYYSYIIVPAASQAKSLADLRAKRFAFTDPMSNTGKLVPVYMLGQMGERPESFFAETFYTYSHDRSIEMVANNLMDGAAIDGLILDYMRSQHPELSAKVKIIKKSAPFGIPPVVVPKGLAPVLKEQLRNLFLAMHTEQEGLNILKKLHVDRYIVLDDSHYDSIRRMKFLSVKK